MDGASSRQPISKGDKISRNTLNENIGGRVKRIVGGKGILVREVGAQVIVEATEQGGGGRGGSSGVIIAASYSALNALSPADGTIGYITDVDWFYGRRNGAWRILHPYLGTSLPSSIGEQNGDIFYNTSTHKGYQRINGAWTLFTHFA